MSLLGIRMNVLMGKTVPIPLAPWLTEALDKVEVTHNDEGASGFQMVFRIGRGGPAALLDYPTMMAVKAGMRVIITVLFSGIPRVLSDGIITHLQLIPRNEPGESLLCATGEDLTCAMRMEEKQAEHAAQSEKDIVTKIIAEYSKYGMRPDVKSPPLIDPPSTTERVPVQRGSDLAYIKLLGQRFGYDFYITPGPVPGLNQAYWGPRNNLGVPQRALTVNMGPATNVESINFKDDSQEPVSVSGFIQDRQTNKMIPIQTLVSTRIPIALSLPNPTSLRKVLYEPSSGLTATQSLSRAQGCMDASMDTMKVDGKVDTTRYNNILWPRKLVGLRGVGFKNDGFYYVNKVTHCIERGTYQQEFTLSRSGSGSLVPVVVP